MKTLYEFIESADPQDLANFCREVARLRVDDVNDFTNLPNVFMRGRKVGKIPATSADITDGDRVGDFNYATSGGSEYLFVCMDVGGNAVWRRVVLGSF